MRPEKSKRVDTNPKQDGLAGLGDALAGLNLGPLPDGPAQPPPGVVQKQRKLGRVVLRRETAHRGGKTVVVVYDFPTSIPLPEIEALAKRLRQGMGTGGAVKDRTVEIQGDNPAKVRALLEKEGWQVAGV